MSEEMSESLAYNPRQVCLAIGCPIWKCFADFTSFRRKENDFSDWAMHEDSPDLYPGLYEEAAKYRQQGGESVAELRKYMSNPGHFQCSDCELIPEAVLLTR